MTTCYEIVKHTQALSVVPAITFSHSTNKWYVTNVHLGITSDKSDIIAGAAAPHCDSPYDALLSWFDALRQVAEPDYIVTNAMREGRGHWRWNGLCFIKIN